MKTIASKLVKIMNECNYIKKSGTNDFHKYKYATSAEVLEKIKNENCKLEKNAEKIVFPQLLTTASAIGAGIIPLSNIYDFDLILKSGV